MKGIVIINGYPNGEKFYRQGERIAIALRSIGIEAEVKRNGEAFALLTGDGRAETSIQDYDFVVYLDKDKYLGKLLEYAGLRLFNSACSVEVCDDKMQTYLALAGKGVKLVESIPAPLCYTKGAKVDEKALGKVAEKLGFPMVVKKSYGSFGTGVQLVHGMPELIKISQEWLFEPHFYQRYIGESEGRDIRVIVVGGKAVAAMERRSQTGEFRSNIELGGKGYEVELSEKFRETAERAARALGLDYCGVDLLISKEGALVCEVNSNAFFEGIEGVTGVDIALCYARHIQKTMQGKKK